MKKRSNKITREAMIMMMRILFEASGEQQKERRIHG